MTFALVLFIISIIFIVSGTLLAIYYVFNRETFTFSSLEDLEKARSNGTNTWYKRIRNNSIYKLDDYLGTYYMTPFWYYPYVRTNSEENYAIVIKKNFEQRFRRMPWLNIGTATIREPKLSVDGEKWLLQVRYDPIQNLFTYRVIRGREYMWLKEKNVLSTGSIVHRIRYPLVKMQIKLF